MRKNGLLLLAGAIMLAGALPMMTISGFGNATPNVEKNRADTDDSKSRFKALMKRLPEIVVAWAKTTCDVTIAPEIVKVRLARIISTTDAKVTLVLEDGGGADSVLTLYLRYYAGSWTTTSFKGNWHNLFKGADQCALPLILAIDKGGEK
jgi:hypothetical protein